MRSQFVLSLLLVSYQAISSIVSVQRRDNNSALQKHLEKRQVKWPSDKDDEDDEDDEYLESKEDIEKKEKYLKNLDEIKYNLKEKNKEIKQSITRLKELSGSSLIENCNQDIIKNWRNNTMKLIQLVEERGELLKERRKAKQDVNRYNRIGYLKLRDR